MKNIIFIICILFIFFITREVTFEEGKEFASRQGINFIEVSAKISTNVDKAFYSVTDKVHYKIQNQIINLTMGKNVRIYFFFII